MASYGFTSLNKNLNNNLNNGFNVQTALATSGLITTGRVVSIVLDDSHPLWEEVGEYNGIGTIEFQSVTDPQSNFSLAKPFFTNNTKYPLINEIVYIMALPNTDIGNVTTDTTKYYIDTVGIWNHPHHNGFPYSPNTPPPAQQKDYVETEAGSVRRVTDQSTEINLGNTFVERANIHPLQAYEGDVIYEGRWGNSIRFGSTVNGFTNWSTTGSNGDPIMILRNGQGDQSNEGWVTINEDINNDDSSIYLTSTQNILLNPTSEKYNSYNNPPEKINKFAGKQILVNSGRLVFNTTTNHILLNSQKSVGINAIESFNVDSPKSIIQSNEIYLGGKNATEPILKGDITVDLLSQLVQQLINLTKILGFVTPLGGPGVSQAAQTLVPFLNTLKTQIETTTKSKVSKTL
jgi:hypothetical protein